MFSQYFDSEYIAVVEGEVDTARSLLELDFDHIFFTGSTNVGKVVMKAAARNLTPVVLELGGKSPCIVDASANVSRAAKRITMGKFLNCGQTCTSPDYLLAHSDIKDKLLQEIKGYIGRSMVQTLHPAWTTGTYQYQ